MGQRILELLEQKDMTQRELAQKLGITEVSVSRYINGTHKPHSDIISKIAECLNVSVDYLLGRTSNKNEEELIQKFIIESMETSFSQRLIELLESNNISQRELAMKVGVQEATISRYINEHRAPHSIVVSKIAEVLGTTTDYLLGNSDNKDFKKSKIAVTTNHKPTIGEKVDALPEKERLIIEALIASWEIKKGKDEPSPADRGNQMEQNA
jgi:transcriptional regulator with XRE-family HTH domain